jgi:hypothetical protein
MFRFPGRSVKDPTSASVPSLSPKQRNCAEAAAAAAASAVPSSDKSSKGPVLMAYRDRFDTDQVKTLATGS